MPKWFGIVFALLLAAAIFADVDEDLADDTPNFAESMMIDRLADKEAAATILAKAEASAVFKRSSGAAAAEAARATALKVLLDGGCIEWEMSQWDPTRGMAPRAQPKSRPDAEADCHAQAEAIVRRIAPRAASSGGAPR